MQPNILGLALRYAVCCGAMQAAAAEGDTDGVERCLKAIAEGVKEMKASLQRMTEKCDPHIYFERVRVPVSGWRNNDALPNGLVYEGMHPFVPACARARVCECPWLMMDAQPQAPPSRRKASHCTYHRLGQTNHSMHCPAQKLCVLCIAVQTQQCSAVFH